MPRSALLEALFRQAEPVAAEATLDLLEKLLDTLSVLDKTYLQNGEWCFVSFPAQLLATSVLTAMSNNASRLFPSNFWNTQGIDNPKKDRQREVLRWLETARTEHHAEQNAQPIRFIYVAWSLIKLDGRILFYQREDTQKRHDKTAGDYGLPGGRANQNDIVGVADPAQMLAALQAPNSALVLNALPSTLQRELREEAGLRFDEHYQFSLWRRLMPYRQVQGAAPNHALTEYYLDVFRIELTLEGFLYLQQRIAQDQRLVWLTPNDIERGASDDGKIPYIKALYDDFAGDRTALVAALAALPDSFAAAYRLDKDNYGITLPLAVAKPIRAGRPGKEQSLDLDLSFAQLQLLLGLAAHLCGFEFHDSPRIKRHPFGWIDVIDDTDLQQELLALATALQGSDLIVEAHRDRYFRLSVRPELVFFDADLYAFSVNAEKLAGTEAKIPVEVLRQEFPTALGTVDGKAELFKLTLELANKLVELARQPVVSDNDEAVKIEDAYKKSLDQEPRFKALGLRKLVHRADGMIRFAVPCLVKETASGADC
ncbi:MAG: NUDIX hydrolase [Methylomonas sp.]|nr:NUDIX hydrolase [Methylomonas sp.]